MQDWRDLVTDSRMSIGIISAKDMDIHSTRSRCKTSVKHLFPSKSKGGPYELSVLCVQVSPVNVDSGPKGTSPMYVKLLCDCLDQR